MEKVKEFLKSLVPPLILDNLRRSKKQQEGMWTGSYSDWEEASLACSGYDQENILEKCKESLLRVRNGEAVYERDSVLFHEAHHNYPLLAWLLKIGNESNGSLNIMDFGGSLGSTYFQCRGFLRSLIATKWGIVEQPHFVKAGKAIFEDNELRFFYSLDECINGIQPKVLLLSSVLQYLKDPYEWIATFVNLQLEYIIIDRTAFTESSCDMLTVQKVPASIYEASYPSWFFNPTKFLAAFNDSYEIVDEFDVSVDPKEFVNGNKTYRKGFILKLRSSEA